VKGGVASLVFHIPSSTKRRGEPTQIEWDGACSSRQCWLSGGSLTTLPRTCFLFLGKPWAVSVCLCFPFLRATSVWSCFFAVAFQAGVGRKRPRRLPFSIRCGEIVLYHWLISHRLVCWGSSFLRWGHLERGGGCGQLAWVELELDWRSIPVKSWISVETRLGFGIGTLGVAFCWDADHSCAHRLSTIVFSSFRSLAEPVRPSSLLVWQGASAPRPTAM
jgi:hypothetical protein